MKLGDLLRRYWLLLFYVTAIVYFELIYRLWSFKTMDMDFVFPMLFALYPGAVLFLLSSMFRERINKIIAAVLLSLVIICYEIQLIYFAIFRTPLSLFSIGGADDALEFKGILFATMMKNLVAILLVLLPLALLFILSRRLSFSRIKQLDLYYILLFTIVGHYTSIFCVNLTDENMVSQRTLYYEISSPELSAKKLGILTTMKLDFKGLVFDAVKNDAVEQDPSIDNGNDAVNTFGTTTTEVSPEDVPMPIAFNTMNIDFDTIIANEKNETLLDMHNYFAKLKPTEKNKYTGMFKGNNLILITAEAFSPYAIRPELTPTLYEMSTKGFVFKNFYNPVWGVSTSDGEYVACTGLIPKSGIWSFYWSGKNTMPFVMGNQFKSLGYKTNAYHNHTYTYYKRNISHPNMGYDFKAVGNGLKVKNTWPESDLEMIEATADEYIGSEPFHAYYMTVSGHMNYSYDENYIARKNKAYVDNLPYSDAPKAYIASNLELEFALKALMEKLEAAGVAENTVIAISADHYPYGLSKESIDELAGHKVEENFELYRSSLILWKKGMEPVIVDKPCSSLDIIPTLSNLFGLEYDSRLLMGSDILSDAPPLVIFSNRSWLTDKARYNSLTGTVTYVENTQESGNYIEQINNIVSEKFKYSAKILEKNYYNKVVPKR